MQYNDNVNYYDVLGVEKSTDDEIKKAYRKLSLKFHPDREGGDEAKYRKLMLIPLFLIRKKESYDFENIPFQRMNAMHFNNDDLTNMLFQGEKIILINSFNFQITLFLSPSLRKTKNNQEVSQPMSKTIKVTSKHIRMHYQY